MKYLLFGILIMAISCSPIVALHPLSENKNDFIFNNSLIGEWKSTKDNGATIFVDTVTSNKGPVYHILLNDDFNIKIGAVRYKNKPWFFARLIKLNSNLYLDIWFDVNHLNIDTTNHRFANWEAINADPLLYPGHQIIKIEIFNESHLSYSSINSEKLFKLIKSKQINLNVTKVKSSYSIFGESYLILNESKQLQNFIIQANKLGLFETSKDLIHKVSDKRIYMDPEIDFN